MSDLERLLESIAREAAHAIEDAANDTALEDSINPVLKRRLLPLLEAGQAMYDYLPAHSNPYAAWVEAKQKALEP